MGLDQETGSHRQLWPLAPPSTIPYGIPLARSPRASTPGWEANFPTFGSGMPLPKSCSVHVVSHHSDGFLRATARGLVASLCRPWGSSRFLRDSPKTCAFPATLPPLEELPRPAVGSPVTRCLGPPDVPPRFTCIPRRTTVSGRAVRGRIVEAATFGAFSVESVRNVVVRCRTPTPCPSWASDSSSRRPSKPWPVARPRHRSLDSRRAHRSMFAEQAP